MSAALDQERIFAVHRLGLGEPRDADLARSIPIEAPVAFEYNGLGYAVMMATPSDLEAFAVGFSLAEGLIVSASEIADIAFHQAEGGWVVRVALPPDRMDIVLKRARARVSESSCGICGIDSIEEALRPLPPLSVRIAITRRALARALAELRDHQPLGRSTGAAHAAAFCSDDGAIIRASEDVGRHNALDKLIGRLALDGIDCGTGFILLTARCSYELVEKTVRAGCPMLVTISAPTTLAADRAKAAGLTLVALARPDSALVINDPHGAFR
ncbi:formate dehydrogenase accessory sulfurtransferase FdhD [Novosphingobium tardum]|uniref:Sulfur carrier protein FdhD n=1 Tax=Novosphingobium tardum TaxID=1538021 RepID=A0ABV8RSL9_9SPHN